MKTKAQFLICVLIGAAVGGAWPLVFHATAPQVESPRYNENIDLRPKGKPTIYAPLPEEKPEEEPVEVPEVKPQTPAPKPNEVQPAIPAATPAPLPAKPAPAKVPAQPAGKWTWVPAQPAAQPAPYCPSGQCGRRRGLLGF